MEHDFVEVWFRSFYFAKWVMAVASSRSSSMGVKFSLNQKTLPLKNSAISKTLTSLSTHSANLEAYSSPCSVSTESPPPEQESRSQRGGRLNKVVKVVPPKFKDEEISET